MNIFSICVIHPPVTVFEEHLFYWHI